ncbi:MAG: chorismate mutase [Proteobacteria bacterium]|nr:chorismate mutase [Pseudomonadota bacterium]MDA0845106.1 chorismate mutase [Pseudomonadota bacterium]
MSDKLHELRDAIDQIDAEILQLIAHRMTLSDEVIAAKNGEAAFRPGREAALVRRLAAMDSDMAPAVLLGIWRQIMAASLTRQNKDVTFAVHQAALPAAIWHMGSALTARHCDDFDAVLALLDTARCRYGLVPATTDDTALAQAICATPKIYIMARTPLFPIPTVTPAYILADYLPDESGDDISLFAVPRADDGLQIVAVDGYFDDHLPEACGPAARLLGIYAR